MIGDFDWDRGMVPAPDAAANRADEPADAGIGPVGTLTIKLKGGDFMQFRNAPIDALLALNHHIKTKGFTGWAVVLFDCQNVAVNMSEVTIVYFNAHPNRPGVGWR